MLDQILILNQTDLENSDVGYSGSLLFKKCDKLKLLSSLLNNFKIFSKNHGNVKIVNLTQQWLPHSMCCFISMSVRLQWTICYFVMSTFFKILMQEHQTYPR